MRLRAALGLGVVTSVLLAACSGAGDPAEQTSATGEPGAETSSEPLRPALQTPAEPTTVLAGETAAQLAVAASAAVFESAPVVVLADAADDVAVQGAAAVARELSAPVLLTPPPPGPPPTISATPPPGPPGSTDAATTTATPAEPAVSADEDLDLTATATELGRLEPSSVVVFGAGATALAESLFDPGAIVVAPEGARSLDELPSELPPVAAPEPTSSVTVLSTGGPADAAALATLEAGGATVLTLGAPDPRADPAAIAALAADQPEHVLALGTAFGTPDQFAYRVGVAKTGVELPGGGQVLYPYHRHIALYGNPTTAGLGALGEQGLPESISRAIDLAAQYQEFTEETTVPTFELIATVASSVPSSGGDYSTEMTPDVIRPYVDAAREAGVYVVLDLQPGRSDFLTQAKLYEEFLLQPHVGLALDPEWRLEPDQVHLEQVGIVTAAEVNSVVTWLADLTRDNQLPQKLLVLHQFRTIMISDRPQVDTSRDELAVLIHVDGFGPIPSKFSTWNTIRADAPANVWWGWKNFIDEDSPLMTPEQTMAVDPVPQFVSYQ